MLSSVEVLLGHQSKTHSPFLLQRMKRVGSDLEMELHSSALQAVAAAAAQSVAVGSQPIFAAVVDDLEKNSGGKCSGLPLSITALLLEGLCEYSRQGNMVSQHPIQTEIRCQHTVMR